MRTPPILHAVVALLTAAGGCTRSDGGSGASAGFTPAGEVVEITIDPGTADGTLDERYLGYAFDTAQLSGGKWWEVGGNERVVPETPDFESDKLRNLVSQVAPSRMRIGGTDCDGAYFCPDEGECDLPPSYQTAFKDTEKRLPSTLTHDDLRRAADFAEAVDARVMMCLNFGGGPRDETTGEWTPDNARELIDFVQTLPNGELFDIWEAGNEANVISVHFNSAAYVDPPFYANDLATLESLIDETAPGTLLAAPGAYFYPQPDIGDFGDFSAQVLTLAADHLDIATWHLYATQSQRCGQSAAEQPFPAGVDTLFDEDIIATTRGYARGMREAAGNLPLWNGESASAQCGGQAGVSDTLLDALWYLDWYGIMAQEGTSLIVRQTIVGSDYGMLEPGSYDPRPTFNALVMMRRLVRDQRLATTAERQPLKAHGWCSAATDEAVTVVISNPAEIAYTAAISSASGPVSAKYWELTAEGGLTGKTGLINGEAAAADGTIPFPDGLPAHISGGEVLVNVQPTSAVFVEIVPSSSGVCGG